MRHPEASKKWRNEQMICTEDWVAVEETHPVVVGIDSRSGWKPLLGVGVGAGALRKCDPQTPAYSSLDSVSTALACAEMVALAFDVSHLQYWVEWFSLSFLFQILEDPLLDFFPMEIHIRFHFRKSGVGEECNQ